MTDNRRKFETERTRLLRSGKLSDYENGLLDKVEEFGCIILHVQDPNDTRPQFSYSIGLQDTRHVPEMITCGLPAETAQAALNDAAELLATGLNLTEGRHEGIVGNVEAEFRPVDPKWIANLMRSAIWFNGSSDFPVLQLVFPDLENRFPGEEGFNSYFDQPLLQPNAPMRHVEEDFWASNDPSSSLFSWEFPDPPHTGVILSKSVNEGAEPITYVSHDTEDGAWQFLGDSMSDSGGVLVCFHHPIDKDSSLKELADLPVGWYAERDSPGQPWTRREAPIRDEATE
jgi:hypothetical protein